MNHKKLNNFFKTPELSAVQQQRLRGKHNFYRLIPRPPKNGLPDLHKKNQPNPPITKTKTQNMPQSCSLLSHSYALNSIYLTNHIVVIAISTP